VEPGSPPARKGQDATEERPDPCRRPEEEEDPPPPAAGGRGGDDERGGGRTQLQPPGRPGGPSGRRNVNGHRVGGGAAPRGHTRARPRVGGASPPAKRAGGSGVCLRAQCDARTPTGDEPACGASKPRSEPRGGPALAVRAAVKRAKSSSGTPASGGGVHAGEGDTQSDPARVWPRGAASDDPGATGEGRECVSTKPVRAGRALGTRPERGERSGAERGEGPRPAAASDARGPRPAGRIYPIYVAAQAATTSTLAHHGQEPTTREPIQGPSELSERL
jgi:hypothetical protein